MTDLVYPPPMPEWGRPGEAWRIEPEPDWVALPIDGPEEQCGGDNWRCVVPATAARLDGRFANCVRHLAAGGMWIENERVVSWRLSR